MTWYASFFKLYYIFPVQGTCECLSTGILDDGIYSCVHIMDSSYIVITEKSARKCGIGTEAIIAMMLYGKFDNSV